MPLEEENRTISINGDSVAPGEDKLLRIEIARLPTGTLIDIPIHIFNAKKAGPTVLVQAGLHGDEINGVETLRRMLANADFSISKGAVIVVPILNVFGFIHFSRDVPDGKDVNRSFPGRKSGSLASRIAYHYTQEILPQIDFGLDLHTGGGPRHNFPQMRYTEGDEMSLKLATLFNAPFSFASNLISGSFRKVAHKLGKPIAVYEAGESMRFDEGAIANEIKPCLGNIARRFVEGPQRGQGRLLFDEAPDRQKAERNFRLWREATDVDAGRDHRTIGMRDAVFVQVFQQKPRHCKDPGQTRHHLAIGATHTFRPDRLGCVRAAKIGEDRQVQLVRQRGQCKGLRSEFRQNDVHALILQKGDQGVFCLSKRQARRSVLHPVLQKPPRSRNDIPAGQPIAPNEIGLAVGIIPAKPSAHDNSIPTEQMLDVTVDECLTTQMIFAGRDCYAHEGQTKEITRL